jgi:hypothetical protein
MLGLLGSGLAFDFFIWVIFVLSYWSLASAGGDLYGLLKLGVDYHSKTPAKLCQVNENSPCL